MDCGSTYESNSFHVANNFGSIYKGFVKKQSHQVLTTQLRF